MIDLPQHAGQIILLRDMLLGNSPWEDFFHVNIFTPYLLMYGLALPLSFFLPIVTALKLLLSIAYIAFVYMCVQIRKYVGADPHVDWLFLVSFFGFSYNWGFLTYLTASPIGLAFILLSMKYANRPAKKLGLGLMALGTILLESHGLVFLYAWGVSAGTFAFKHFRDKEILKFGWPYALLLFMCLCSFAFNESFNQSLQIYLPTGFAWEIGPSRIPKIFIYALLANPPGLAALITIPAFLSFLITPFLLGLRSDSKNSNSWIPFIAVMGILLFVPSFAFNTQFLYQRFSLFLIPSYAWLFTRKIPHFDHHLDTKWRCTSAMPIMVLLCWGMLSLHSIRAWRFSQEAADFDHVMAAVEPKSRALALVFDRDSEAAGNIKIYTQYPTWYEAEKSGLVDFNFGWMPSLVVRYKEDHLPAIRPGFEWHPESFDWIKNHGDDYRYFFVRMGKEMPHDLFKDAKCPPHLLRKSGSWEVFERYSCGA